LIVCGVIHVEVGFVLESPDQRLKFFEFSSYT
jgi:hypothetical protein